MTTQDKNRGPARWERARNNAIKRPTTKAAELYRQRLSMAHEVSHAVKDPQPRVFSRERVYDPTERHYVCSTLCMAMSATLLASHRTLLQLQGDLSVSSESGIHLGSYVLTPARHIITRTVRCFHCGDAITVEDANFAVDDRILRMDRIRREIRCRIQFSLPFGEENESSPSETRAPLEPESGAQLYVYDGGTANLIPLSSATAHAVSLTAEQARLLNDYGTPESRERYLHKEGTRVQICAK